MALEQRPDYADLDVGERHCGDCPRKNACGFFFPAGAQEREHGPPPVLRSHGERMRASNMSCSRSATTRAAASGRGGRLKTPAPQEPARGDVARPSSAARREIRDAAITNKRSIDGSVPLCAQLEQQILARARPPGVRDVPHANTSLPVGVLRKRAASARRDDTRPPLVEHRVGVTRRARALQLVCWFVEDEQRRLVQEHTWGRA